MKLPSYKKEVGFGYHLHGFGTPASSRVKINLIISADTTNVDVYTSAVATGQYVAGSTDVTLTINSGIYVGSTSTGTYACTVSASFNADDTVTIVNNGVIIGKGGAGGSTAAGVGGAGGYALLLNSPCSIDNQGSIYGGGGGGGGGGRGRYGCNDKTCSCTTLYQGGSGGSGAGYTVTGSASKTAQGGNTSPGWTAYCYGGTVGCTNVTCGTRVYRGPGGVGGAPGVNGSAGGASSYSKIQACTSGLCQAYSQAGGAGGARGYYIVNGATYATWITAGTTGGQST